MSEQDDDERGGSGLAPGSHGADEMGGATGVTGGGESGAPGEGVQSTDSQASDAGGDAATEAGAKNADTKN